MNTQPPSLGRIVLFRPVQTGAVDKQARPAMILEILGDESAGDRVRLQVFTPLGDRYLDAKWSEQGDEGTWFWPPRVKNRAMKVETDDPKPEPATVDAAKDAAV